MIFANWVRCIPPTPPDRGAGRSWGRPAYADQTGDKKGPRPKEAAKGFRTGTRSKPRKFKRSSATSNFWTKKPSVLHRGLEADRSIFLLINAQIAASYMARAGPVSSGVEARACPLQQLQKTQGGWGCFRIYRPASVRRFRPRKM